MLFRDEQKSCEREKGLKRNELSISLDTKIIVLKFVDSTTSNSKLMTQTPFSKLIAFLIFSIVDCHIAMKIYIRKYIIMLT